MTTGQLYSIFYSSRKRSKMKNYIHFTQLQKSQLGYVGEMLTEHFSYRTVSFERRTTTFYQNVSSPTLSLLEFPMLSRWIDYLRYVEREEIFFDRTKSSYRPEKEGGEPPFYYSTESFPSREDSLCRTFISLRKLGK